MVTLVVSEALVEPLLAKSDDLFGATVTFELSGGGGGGGAIDTLLITLLELQRENKQHLIVINCAHLSPVLKDFNCSFSHSFELQTNRQWHTYCLVVFGGVIAA